MTTLRTTLRATIAALTVGALALGGAALSPAAAGGKKHGPKFHAGFHGGWIGPLHSGIGISIGIGHAYPVIYGHTLHSCFAYKKAIVPGEGVVLIKTRVC